MAPVHKSCLILLAALVCQAAGAAQPVVTRGFDTTVPPAITSQELSLQPSLWVLEVSFKPIRMIYVDITDPKTGQKKRELIWYLVYRVVNRAIDRGQDTTDVVPMNAFDDPQGPPILAPEITLLTDDAGIRRSYMDEVLPEAQLAIERRERQNLKNSVQIVGAIPEVPASGQIQDNAVYGVATWRGVDPRTDYFSVMMSGLSNGYLYVRDQLSFDQLQQMAADGEVLLTDLVWDGKNEWVGASEIPGVFDDSQTPSEDALAATWSVTVTPDRFDESNRPTVWRKTLMQKYWRPSDEYQPDESEIRQQGDARWVYQADDIAGMSTFRAAPTGDSSSRKGPAKPERPAWEQESPVPAMQPDDKQPNITEPEPEPPAGDDMQPAQTPVQPEPPQGGSPSVLGDLFKNLDKALKGGSGEE